MYKSDVRTVIKSSSLAFYQKIMKKHQTYKIKNISFPRMIFNKNGMHSSPKKFEMTFHLKIRLYSQINVLSPVLENNSMINGVISRENNGRNTLNPIKRQKNTSDADNVKYTYLTALSIQQTHHRSSGIFQSSSFHATRISIVSFLKSLVPKTVNLRTELGKPLKPMLILSTFLDKQTKTIIPLSSIIINSQIPNYENNMKILNSQMPRAEKAYGLPFNFIHTSIFNKKNVYKNLSEFSILPQHNFFINSTNGSNKPFFEESNKGTVNKPSIKDYYGRVKHYGFGPIQKNYTNYTGAENLYFQDSRHIEQEIEQIKKAVIQTKESVLEKLPSALGETDIKRHIDINRISDQVYQNLERRIRLERERRGI